MIQLLGCVGNEQGRCNACNTGKCPTGICTQNTRLVKRLDVDKGAQRIVDYVLAFDSELRKLMAPIGNSSLPVGRSDALVSTDKAIADKLGIERSKLSMDTVSEAMKEKNVPDDLTQQFIDTLNNCEFARFAPGNSEEKMGDLYQKGIEVITKAEKVL